MTHTSTHSLEDKNTKFSAHSLKPSEKVDLALAVLQTRNQTLSEPPWTVWHRPLDWLTERTHDWIPTRDLRSFYSINSDDIKF
jgi:hypothetical protein